MFNGASDIVSANRAFTARPGSVRRSGMPLGELNCGRLLLLLFFHHPGWTVQLATKCACLVAAMLGELPPVCG